MSNSRIRRSLSKFNAAFSILGIAVLVATVFLIAPFKAQAEEPAQRFLDELRANHYYDVAIDYLDQMQTSPLVTQAFKARIPLEKANTMMSSIARMRDPRKREATLDQAQTTLEEFLATNPPADVRSMAERTRANLLIARAGMLIEKTKNSRLAASQLQSLREQARDFLTAAGKSFEQNRAKLRTEIKNLGTPAAGSQERGQLDNLQDEYVIVRRVAPTIKEKIADTYTDGSPERKKLLSEAAEEFADIFTDYSDKRGGLDAALFSARCNAKIDQFDVALTMLTLNIFAQDNVPAFYEIKRRGALIGLECWESQDPLPFNEIIHYIGPIVQNIKPEEKKQPDWLQLQLGLAKACKIKSDTIRKDRPKSQDERRTMKEMNDVAIDLARFVSKARGPLRDEARALLVNWNEKVGDDVVEKEVPKTVGEARDRGREMIAEIEDISSQLKAIENQMASGEGDPETLKTEMESLNAELNEIINETLSTLELALNLADDQTPVDDISYVRYLQAYCYYRLDLYLETSVIGRFLMDSFPDKPGAREAMGLVCKAYWRMFNEAEEGQNSFELAQLVKNCTDVLEQWPGSAESESAAQLMTIVSLKSGDSINAEKYINTIPESSPTRMSLTLNVGQSVWQEYVLKRKEGGGDELFELRDRAKKYLEDGAATLELERLSSFQARCLLSLVELYLDEGRIDAALERLEKADIAPLDLVKQKHPASQSSAYRLDTYRAAVRAYLSALQTGQDTQVWIEKAQNIIDALGREFESQENGQKKLVSVYYRLANELKTQFDALEDKEQKTSFGTGLDVFLSGIAKNAKDTQVLIWCGSTMSDVGQSLFEADSKELGRKMFQKAIDVFDRVGGGDANDPSTQRTMLRKKALALRGMGKFEDSIAAFKELFADAQNRKYIDLQYDAAETFQDWGITKKNEKALSFAVSGGIRQRDLKTNKEIKTAIGWKQIATIARSSRSKSPAHMDRYVSSVLNFATCKFEYAKLTKNDKVFKSALKDVNNFQSSQPDSGGAKWKPRFDALKGQIQSQLN